MIEIPSAGNKTIEKTIEEFLAAIKKDVCNEESDVALISDPETDIQPTIIISTK
jgi:hypothetical protein